MKIMIISDIHGGYEDLEKVLDIFEKEKYDKLFILGDLYSYYDSIENDYVINRLNNIENKLIVRGNCDFDMNIPEILNISLNGLKMTLTHGHKNTKEYLLNLDTDIIFIGHTHKPCILFENNKYIVNPGSIHKSREGENTFASIDNNTIYIKSINNEILNTEKIKSEM